MGFAPALIKGKFFVNEGFFYYPLVRKVIHLSAHLIFEC
jgi:hypothetical protein